MTTAAQLIQSVRYKFHNAAIITEVQLNDPDANEDSTAWSRRIDALIFEGNQQTTAIEVKISRADFLRDTLEKRAPWMAVTNRFVYVTPQGLVKPHEVPADCGLWEYDGYRLRTVVRWAESRPGSDSSPGARGLRVSASTEECELMPIGFRSICAGHCGAKDLDFLRIAGPRLINSCQ